VAAVSSAAKSSVSGGATVASITSLKAAAIPAQNVSSVPSLPEMAAGPSAATSYAVAEAATDLVSESCKITRAVERCDTFGGSIAILDQDQEAWLFDIPEMMTPIDPSSATRGRSIQSRPWQSDLEPTFYDSVAEFCTHLVSLSSHDAHLNFLTTSKNVSIMYSVELDAFLHRCGTVCVVMHGNGDWATVHSSQIPSSFKDATLLSFPLKAAHSIPDFFLSSLPHIGSWNGCGGNMQGISGCAGNGNCSALCLNCGARSHWTCCGSSDQFSATCSGPMTSLQAKENDRLFRLVARESPIPCSDIGGLSGGKFSVAQLMSMPGLSGASNAAIVPSFGGSAATQTAPHALYAPPLGAPPAPTFGVGFAF
jgi:hypothetical protein